jgi:pimeloyl-ACP methyl ester carboxylesterase
MTLAIKRVLTPDLDLAYEEHGPADGFPVLLLHGWPDDVRTWDALGSALAADGYRVLLPYLRGFGPTRFRSADTPRSGQLAALGQDAIDFANALDIGRFAVIGHDWGARAAGIVTSELQETGRVTHLVMMSVGYGTNSPNQALSLKQTQNYWYQWYMATERGREHLAHARREFTRHMWRIWAPDWPFSDQDFEVTARSFDNPDWLDVVIHSYRHRWAFVEGDPRYEALERRLNPAPAISVPTLLLHGAADACNDPSVSEGKEHFFTGRYVRKLLPGVGHFPQREASSDVCREVLAWLET